MMNTHTAVYPHRGTLKRKCHRKRRRNVISTVGKTPKRSQYIYNIYTAIHQIPN